MLTAAALLLTALTLLLFSPFALTAGSWQVRAPRLALLLWFTALFAGCALVLAAIAQLVASALLAGAATSTQSTTLTIAAWASLGAVGGILTFVGASAEPLSRSWRASAGRVAPVAAAREQRRGFTLVWFNAPDAAACAIPSRRPEILVSLRLREILTEPQLQAVIAHEYAHLRQRHGWAVRIAEINALCVPFGLRAGRALKRATLLLVELIADDTAARQVGAVHLANALVRMAEDSGDAGMAVRAERLTMRRWPSATRRRIPEPIRI